MKKIFLFLAISLFSIPAMYAVVTWDGTSSEMWTQGTGTEADPYLIETPANLAYLSAQVTAGETYAGVYFQQTEDFDLQSKTWRPIGTSTYKFAGIYNGANKYVSNIQTSQYGLFGITENTKIMNLVFQGTFSGASTSAPLIGEAYGSTEILNCHNFATIADNKACAGLIACAYGTSVSLNNCSNHEGIKLSLYTSTGITELAGLVAYATCNVIMADCYNKGDLQSAASGLDHSYCGGLLGRSTADVTMLRCFNQGNIVATEISSSYFNKATAAGLCGGGNSKYTSCYNIGNISASVPKSGNGWSTSAYAYGLGASEICIGCYVSATINASANNQQKYLLTSGGTVESCYTIGAGTMPSMCSNVYHNQSSITNGTYKSDIAFKDPSMISLLNTIDDYFTMDLEGINDGYPILKWQAGPRFTITGSCDANRGTVKGGGEYAPGNTVTLTATPKKGCTFVGWSDGVTDNPRTVTVEGDATYIAQFTKSNYTIYVNQDCTSYIE